jgi:uncharacterized protein
MMMKVHMQKNEREITDQQVMLDVIKKGKFAMIAMCRENEPYVVTLSYGYDNEHQALYLHTAKKGLKLDFIAENPSVCATVIEDLGYLYNECAHAFRSVVFWGSMSVVESIDEKKHGMSVLMNHLEEDPAPIRARTLKNDRVYDAFTVLKLEISHMTGKEGR